MKKEQPSDLVAAVEALEHELLQLDRHAEQALRQPLNSEKHLQQVASSLGAIGAMEGRLGECMGQLMTALQGLAARQQEKLNVASARADELKARHQIFQALMQRYTGLGTSANELQALATAASSSSPAEALPSLIEKLAALVAESEALEAQATADDFVDLVRHARSLRQQLSAAHLALTRKIEKLSAPRPNGAH
ncbi:MAG: hypothetical protein Q8O67_15410 [Deltaproteobacteria bacterium]|nr:hypothetical protein [Deltaproteobacteria bacterium]